MPRIYYAGAATHELVTLVGMALGLAAYGGMLAGSWLGAGIAWFLAAGLIIGLLKAEASVVWALIDAKLVCLRIGRSGPDMELAAPARPVGVALDWSLDPLTVCAVLEFEDGQAWRTPWRFAYATRHEAKTIKAFAHSLGVAFHDRVNRQS